jgi:cytochrome c
MKTLMIALAAASLAVAGTAAAATGAETFQAKCSSCHAADTKKMGPSVKDIQAKGGDAAAIVAKLKEGKGHPKVALGDDDLKAAVTFALTGK